MGYSSPLLLSHMKTAGHCLVILWCALADACNSPNSPTSEGYAGQWSGTTGQGRPIAFTISRDETVTTISVGHDFDGCSGTETFPNLSLPIAPQVQCIPAPCPASVSSYRAFRHSSGNPFEGQSNGSQCAVRLDG
jgi:hypothetical protein